MPVNRTATTISKPGNFPVRISLNVSAETAVALDSLALETGASRGVLARAAAVHGLKVVKELWRRRRRYVDPSERALERARSIESAAS